MVLGQVSNGSEELVEYYYYGPRGEKQKKKKPFFEALATRELQAAILISMLSLGPRPRSTIFWLLRSSIITCTTEPGVVVEGVSVETEGVLPKGAEVRADTK